MVCYPDVQRKAQEELDKVLNGRLPEHSDIVSLPYFSALIKEVHRYGEVCFKDSLPHAQHVYFLPDGSLYYHWVILSLVHKVCINLNALTSSRPSASVYHRRSLQRLPYPRKCRCGRQSMVRASPVAKYYIFPGPTTIFLRAMLNDEREYPEPREFRPERFLRNGKIDDSVRDPKDIAFGFGRR